MEPPSEKKKNRPDYDGLIALLLLLFSPLISVATGVLGGLLEMGFIYPAATGWVVAYSFSIGFAISGVRHREGCAQASAAFTLLLIVLVFISFVLLILTAG